MVPAMPFFVQRAFNEPYTNEELQTVLGVLVGLDGDVSARKRVLGAAINRLLYLEAMERMRNSEPNNDEAKEATR